MLTTAGSASVGGGVYAWRYDGSSISGFPKLTEVDAQGPATIADIDQDGQVELLASSNWDTDLEAGLLKYRGSLYVWDIAEPHEALSMEWPHFHRDGQHTGLYRSPAEPPPANPTPAPPPGDTDGDGCSDAQELGPNETLGGGRDPLYYWDLFDVYTGDPPVRDRAVTAGDIGAIVARFGTFLQPPPTNEEALAQALTPPTDATSYHASADRAGSDPEGNLWNLLPPDGAIVGGDIGAMVAQFGHACA